MKLKGIVFIIKNWKLVVHLLLGTSRFGVNNRQHSEFTSIFARKEKLTLKLIIWNYKRAKVRALCGFLTKEECDNLGWK